MYSNIKFKSLDSPCVRELCLDFINLGQSNRFNLQRMPYIMLVRKEGFIDDFLYPLCSTVLGMFFISLVEIFIELLARHKLRTIIIWTILYCSWEWIHASSYAQMQQSVAREKISFANAGVFYVIIIPQTYDHVADKVDDYLDPSPDSEDENINEE
jgi:hypothetical protein